MPRIIDAGSKSNIIKIEPNPNKKCPVQLKMEVINTAGGKPKFTVDENGKKIFRTLDKTPQNISRLPNTIHQVAATNNRNGGLNTGLDEIVTNPFIDLDFYRPGWEQILKGKKRVRLQEMLEYKHGKEKGYYTSQAIGITPSKDLNSAVFYKKSESTVLLNDGVTFLDLNNPIHEINYHMLKAHYQVANSYSEITARTTHFIVDENERATRSASTNRKLNKLGARLEEIMELSDNTIMEFCKALSIAPGVTKSDCYNELNAFARSNSGKYEEFIQMYTIWKDPATREVFEGYVELYEFLEVQGLLVVRNNKVFWSQPIGIGGGKKETWEWKSKEQFIREFLTAPQYQEEAEILRTQYRQKTRY